MSYVDDVIAKAKTQIGVTEVGHSNSGPEVNKYLAAVGLDPGNQWCEAFCMAMCDWSSVPKETWQDLTNRAYVPTLESWGQAKGVLYDSPKRGDFMLLQMWDEKGQYSGHVGIVVQVNPDGTFDSIEGNTSPQGAVGSQSNGGGVYARNRLISSSKYVRWSDLVYENRKVKIFRKPTAATVVVEGKEYPIKQMSINGAAPEAGSEYSIIVDY